jgi:hypothetical protein
MDEGPSSAREGAVVSSTTTVREASTDPAKFHVEYKTEYEPS